MKIPSLFIGCLVLSSVMASEQKIYDRVTGASSVEKAEEPVSDDIATLAIKLEKPVYTKGEPVEVTFLFVAGDKGAYLPNYFKDWIATCERGFSAVILTKDGRLADPTLSGCGGDMGHSFDDTAESEFHNFVYLEPRETRTWKTTIMTAGVPAGSYTVAAEYMSYAYMIEAVAKLPKVNGLMAKGHVIAKPVPVQIR